VDVDLLGGGGVVGREGGAAVCGGGIENGHGVCEAGTAGGEGVGGEGDVEGKVVRVDVGGGGGVGDGVGEAVGGRGGVAEARHGVEGFVGDEAALGLQDRGVLAGDVGGAGRGLGEVTGQGTYVVGAGIDIGSASCVESAGDLEDGLGSLEEGYGILFGSAVIGQEGGAGKPRGAARMGSRTGRSGP
jgi:hypothetical protein